mgnify:CR=1 FL=1
MARILPPSVFKANFEAAEFKPTQSQRVGERFATPEGLKVGVDVIDRVGGTVADAVSRFSRGRAALARARKEVGPDGKPRLGKDTGMWGTQYLTLNEQERAILDQESYGSGQRRVAGARDRRVPVIGRDGKPMLDEQGKILTRVLSGVDDRAAGYEQMRRAWDRPGSGRLLGDPTRDPSRLISEDYKRLASASPLPKAAAAPKLGQTQLADWRARHKTNEPIINDLNAAVYLRDAVATNELLKAGFNPRDLTADQAAALVESSNGLLTLYRDDSGDKTVISVAVKPTAEESEALRAAVAENKPSVAKAIRQGLNARATALLGMLSNPHLDQAAADVGKYSRLVDQYRTIAARNPNDPRLPGLELDINELSGPIAQASGNLPVYLGQSGRRAAQAQVAADKKSSDEVGEMRERLDELNRKEKVAKLSSEEKNEQISLDAEIRKRGGEVPVSGAATEDSAEQYSTPVNRDTMQPMSLRPNATTTATESSQQDAWSRAASAGGLTQSRPRDDKFTQGATVVDEPFLAPGTLAKQKRIQDKDLEPKLPDPRLRRGGKLSPRLIPAEDYFHPPEGENDPSLKASVAMRQAGISEENIELAFPGYSTLPGSDYFGKIKGPGMVHDERRKAWGSDYQRWFSRTEPTRAKTRARMLAAAQKAKGTFQGPPAKPKSTYPKPVGTQKIKQKIGDKTVTHEFPTYKAMAVGSENKKKRLPAVPAKDKARRIELLRSAAKKYKIDPDLYVALADQESKYHDKAVSDQYAIGLTQMTPSAWLDIGGKPEDFKTLFDESVAAESGAKFLALLRKRLIKFKEIKKNDPKENEKIMAVYNAGLSAFRNEGFEINSKKRKDGTFFSGLMNPKRSVPLKDAKGNKIFQKDAKGNKIPLKGKDGKQLKDSKGRLRWKIKTRDGETYNYVTKIMKNYKKIKALAAKDKAKKVKGVADKPGPKAPKEGS